VLHIGSVVLAAVLLGVPRALDARAFGVQGSVYVEVAPLGPELTDLTRELKRAIAGSAYPLASRRSEAATVVELLRVGSARGADGAPMEAASFVIRDASGPRPLVLHYTPGQRPGAARALLEELSRGPRPRSSPAPAPEPDRLA
jgi:hypothetical protein